MLESDDGWVKKGDGRITILYDAFFRLTFVRENGNLNSLVRQVSLQCIYDAHPACASVKITDGTLIRAEEGPNCYMPPLQLT